MVQQVMGGQLRYKQFPPLNTIPPENLPDPWKPGSTHPHFSNGLPSNSLGVQGYQTATGRTATFGPGGGIECATGFMVTPKIVLTAAHLIAPGQDWKKTILFQPSFNNGRPLQYFEKVNVEAAFIPEAYFQINNEGKDYAILVLEREVPSDLLFKLTTSVPGDLNIPGFAIGYPAGVANQQRLIGSIEWATTLRIRHSIPCVSGFSGSAIMAHQFSSNADFAVGIHNSSKKASIISNTMLEEINFVQNGFTATHLNLVS